MELNSQEAITNNVIWLKNIIEVSIENNVKHFCQISTDKAVNPTNIMWATKRLWELILQYYSSKFKNININSVRFGNVLWSSWSVLTIFKEQIEKWENLTVTDENVTRFFMSIEEAVNLVITSVTLNDKWKIYVLDMWEAVKIIDLASQYIKLSWVKNIWIDIIWLKPWEKLYEELILDNSKDKKTNIEKLFITEDKWNINNLLEKIDDLSIINNKKKLIVEIKNIIPEFKHIER
jgi:FlaA1/EpsC-like NDP-sugar epimerase